MKSKISSRIRKIAKQTYMRGTVARTSPGGKNDRTSLKAASNSTGKRVKYG